MNRYYLLIIIIGTHFSCFMYSMETENAPKNAAEYEQAEEAKIKELKKPEVKSEAKKTTKAEEDTSKLKAEVVTVKLLDLPQDLLLEILENTIDRNAQSFNEALKPAIGLLSVNRQAFGLKKYLLQRPAVVYLKNKFDLEAQLQKATMDILPKHTLEYFENKDLRLLRESDDKAKYTMLQRLKKGETTNLNTVIFVQDINTLNSIIPLFNKLNKEDQKDFINKTDSYGNTPLATALINHLAFNVANAMPIVTLLLNLGADANIPNNEGVYPLEAALGWAIYKDDWKQIAQLLWSKTEPENVTKIIEKQDQEKQEKFNAIIDEFKKAQKKS